MSNKIVYKLCNNIIKLVLVLFDGYETAKANGLYPYKYLEWIFKTAPTIANSDAENDYWALLLLPEKAPDGCRTKIQN